MGRVVSLSSDTVHLAMFGDNSNNVARYINTQLESLGNFASNVGNSLYETLQESLNKVTSNLRKNQIREELVGQQFQEIRFEFEELTTFRDLQLANPLMQRWVIAHPELKQHYLDQNINGYENSFVNTSGRFSGEEDYDYRLVMNGIIRTDSETNEDYSTQYFDPLRGDDRELEFFGEQDVILGSWNTIDHYLGNSKYDFTKVSKDPDDLSLANF